MRAHLALLLLLLAPLGSAQFGDYGYMVEDTPDRPDEKLKTGGPNAIRYVDVSGNGLSTDDAIYLAQNTKLKAGDIALNDKGQTPRGEPVAATSSQIDATLKTLSGNLGYFDLDGNNAFNGDDYAIFDQTGIGSGTVSSHDLLLSGSRAGFAPTGNTVGFNGPVVKDSSIQFMYQDVDKANSYNLGDRVYLDMNDDDYAGITDVRLINSGSLAFGEILGFNDADASFVLRDTGTPQTFVFVDETGDSKFGSDEVAYLATNVGTAGASIRLVFNTFGDPGTTVRGSSADFRATRSSLSGNLAISGDGDTLLEAGEVLVYDISGTNNDVADGNDLILSGENAGKLAFNSGTFQNTALKTVSSNFAYYDINGDGAWGLDDILFYDGDNNNFISAGDVQLTLPPAGWVAPEPVPEPTETVTATATDTVTATATDSMTTSDSMTGSDTETDDEGESVPVGFLAPLALLGAVLYLRRRI